MTASKAFLKISADLQICQFHSVLPIRAKLTSGIKAEVSIAVCLLLGRLPESAIAVPIRPDSNTLLRFEQRLE